MPRGSLVLFCAAASVLGQGRAARLQVVFSAECNSLFDWHTAAIFYSFDASNFSRTADLTRLLACSDKEQQSYPNKCLNFVSIDHLCHQQPNFSKPYDCLVYLDVPRTKLLNQLH